mmetsp:Transcript_7238/g.18557  ORF Transcript_7238/g.18557 Transcript_7238/m.18557 type:complete len:206 (-) Transcript_7238:317-934(-)
MRATRKRSQPSWGSCMEARSWSRWSTWTWSGAGRSSTLQKCSACPMERVWRSTGACSSRVIQCGARSRVRRTTRAVAHTPTNRLPAAADPCSPRSRTLPRHARSHTDGVLQPRVDPCDNVLRAAGVQATCEQLLAWCPVFARRRFGAAFAHRLARRAGPRACEWCFGALGRRWSGCAAALLLPCPPIVMMAAFFALMRQPLHTFP